MDILDFEKHKLAMEKRRAERAITKAQYDGSMKVEQVDLVRDILSIDGVKLIRISDDTGIQYESD